jgi:hypothetical protein
LSSSWRERKKDTEDDEIEPQAEEAETVPVYNAYGNAEIIMPGDQEEAFASSGPEEQVPPGQPTPEPAPETTPEANPVTQAPGVEGQVPAEEAAGVDPEVVTPEATDAPPQMSNFGENLASEVLLPPEENRVHGILPPPGSEEDIVE